MKALFLFVLIVSISASLRAQTQAVQLGAGNKAAGWLLPKGTYIIRIDDGPGPMTLKIAQALQSRGIVATFFQNSCHYLGETPDTRSFNCEGPGTVSKALMGEIENAGQCIGNHTADHLVLTGISLADALGEVLKPIDIFKPYLRTDCPYLFVAPGQQWTAALAGAANANPQISGALQGPIGDDLDGSGIIGTDFIPNDQECIVNYSLQQCIQLYLDAMQSSARGGIIAIHDYTPFAPNGMDPDDLKSNYAYALLLGILNGCPKCTFVSAAAIPGIQASLGLNSFQAASDPHDNLSAKIAPLVVGDINGDGRDDILVPRADGIYCGLTAPDARQYPLYLCLPFTDASMVADRYWLADTQGDGLPYVIWKSIQGLMGSKSDGKGYFGESRLLSRFFAGLKISAMAFGRIRRGVSVRDAVILTADGVAISLIKDSGQFGVPMLVPSLAYTAQLNPVWEPQQTESGFMLIDTSGDGLADIAMPGTSSMLRAVNLRGDGFKAFAPLLGNDGFNYWANPSQGYWINFSTTIVAGEQAIAGWAPNGIAYSTINPPAKKQSGAQAKASKSGWLCNECFAGLPGWLASWQTSPTNLINEVGFADFLGGGTTPPQPWLVWQGTLYTAQ